MNKIIGIVLLAIGGVLLFQGLARKDSLAGAASEVGADVANAVDGAGRVPRHVYYIVGGGIVAAAGAGVLLRGGGKK